MTKHNSLFKSIEELNILILEDNMSMVKIYKHILGNFNVKNISFATNVEDAKEMVKTEAPDLIICDFILNGNDKYNNGLAFLRWIRQVDMAPACFTPVLMSTGHASRRIVMEFNKYGASAIVVKPLSPIVLQQRIESILSDTRAYVVDAGRVILDGATKYAKPKQKTNVVYDPGYLSRLVRNDINKNELIEKSKKIELKVEERDIFEEDFDAHFL